MTVVCIVNNRRKQTAWGSDDSVVSDTTLQNRINREIAAHDGWQLRDITPLGEGRFALVFDPDPLSPAMMFDDNPYELLDPPDPDGGYLTADAVWG